MMIVNHLTQFNSSQLYYAMLQKGVIITCYWTIGNTLYDEIQRTIISDKNESGNM